MAVVSKLASLSSTPSILNACEPRADLLTGAFNPAIFTASLRKVLNDYRNGKISNPIYSDPQVFFTEATFPTAGLRRVAQGVFGRLSGDRSFPVVQRLETAFGGGKTHALIAITHLAKGGRVLAEVTGDVIDAKLLPAEGDIDLIAIVGDAVEVHRQQGTELIPHTLWGAIAERVGGEALYRKFKPILESPSAPAADNPYFERLFGGRKVLLIIDELAQYCARCEAARPRGAEQVAAFLMSLLTYAESHPHFAVVVTLASDHNAFGGYNQSIRAVTNENSQLSDDAAEALLKRSAGQVLSVIHRSASGVTPVAASELSKIMARRLFTRIDVDAARRMADAYIAMYRQSGAELPSGVTQEDFRDRIIAHYPFHPTFIEYLSQKLAQVEAFQGTRGVLRTLSRLVRSVWRNQLDVPLLHTCHVDLADDGIRTELLGRTENIDMNTVLEADISKAGAAEDTVGLTVAQQLDRDNPHPRGYPLTEWAWKTVFLHSLVGRAGGLNDERFGVALGQALLETSQPQLPPSQVKSALQKIPREASYLREQDGRFHANTSPTLNIILRRIRDAVSTDEKLQRICDLTRTLLKEKKAACFKVVSDVAEPADIPDKTDRPVLGILGFGLQEFDPEAFITRVGDAPRLHQNYVFILSPSTTHAKGEVWEELRVKGERDRQQRLLDLASWVIAADKLEAQPERWGVQRNALKDHDYVEAIKTRANDLRTQVEQTYSQLHYPDASGNVGCRRIASAGGEGGANLLALIFEALSQDGELITEALASTKEAVVNLSQLFFSRGDLITVAKLREQFARLRQWPVLEAPQLLETLLLTGVRTGQWCLALMADGASDKPTEFYTSAQEPPISVNFAAGHWLIVTPQGAAQRGWGESKTRDPRKLRSWAEEALPNLEAADLESLANSVQEKHGEFDRGALWDQLVQQVNQGRLVAFPNPYLTSDQAPQQAELVYGAGSSQQTLTPDAYAVTTKAEASKRGWLKVEDHEKQFQLSAENTVKRLLNALSSSRFRGSETHLANFYLEVALKGGGRHQFVLEGISADGLARMNEVFQCLQGLIDYADEPLADITVNEPMLGCELVKILTNLEKDNG